MENRNKKLLKHYIYDLFGILVASYCIMLLSADSIGIIEVYGGFYIGIGYSGALLAYKHDNIILRSGRKNIIYSCILIFLVFFMHYYFCIKYSCLNTDDTYEFFLAFYAVVAREIFQFVFYKELFQKEN